jgi:hypothetical protein
VAVADGNRGEVRYVEEIAHTPEAVEKLVRQLRKNSASLSFCYEASGRGYGLHRQLTDLGWDCLEKGLLAMISSSVVTRLAEPLIGCLGFGARQYTKNDRQHLPTSPVHLDCSRESTTFEMT